VKSAIHCAECSQLAQRARGESADTESGLPPTSAKIRMLIKLLQDVEERSGKKEKTIVFSQFTSFLNMVEPFLKLAGIAFVRCRW
jgi:SNF2 family DNA or RNA helicase